MMLILTPNYVGDVERLAKTAEALGWSTLKCQTGWRLPYDIPNTDGAVYGERLFCEVMAQQMKWRLISNEPDWITRISRDYVRRDIIYTTLAEARKFKEKLFIKSAMDDCIEAKTYINGEGLPENTIFDDVPVIAYEWKLISSKYRCFIKNGKVVSICCYYLNKTVNDKINWYIGLEPVIEFVNNMLLDPLVDCARGTVIDIARSSKDQSLFVLKTTPAWRAELYGCELTGALDCIKASCVKE